LAAFVLASAGAQAGGPTPEAKELIKEAMGQADHISPKELKQALAAGEDVTLLDIRQDSERPVLGKLPADDVHIPRGYLEIKAYGMLPDRDQRLVVYCGKGIRSAFATNTLREMGYTNVSNLKGGILAWREAGYETQTLR
jgi:rhodanese-related sulfurtransferase